MFSRAPFAIAVTIVLAPTSCRRQNWLVNTVSGCLTRLACRLALAITNARRWHVAFIETFDSGFDQP
jgi:hypothetical protein